MIAREHTSMGVDFGGVITLSLAQRSVHPAVVTPRSVPPVPGALEALAQLSELFERRVWIVSKAGPATQTWTRKWLKGHDIYRQCGLDPQHVDFVTEDVGKRERCLIHGITHFIDDHGSNLELLAGAVDWLCLFGAGVPDGAGSSFETAPDWEVALELIRASLDRASPGPPSETTRSHMSGSERRRFEQLLTCALDRGSRLDLELEQIDRVDCLIDLRDMFWDVPAAVRVVSEVASRTDDDPIVVRWAGYYLGEMLVLGKHLQLERVDGLSDEGRDGFLSFIEDERPEWADELRARWRMRVQPN